MYKHYVRQKTLWIDTSYDKIGQYLDISPSMCVFSISASLWLPTCLSISAYLFRGGGGACLPTYTFDIASKALDTQYKITVTHPPTHTHKHTRITQFALKPAHASQWSDTRTTKLPRGQLPGRSRMAEWTCHPCVKYLSSATLTGGMGDLTWSSPSTHQ